MLKICCCWDDGVVNDARTADLIRKYHGKATFNLCPGQMADRRKTDEGAYWQTVNGERVDTGYRVGRLGRSELLSVYEGFQVASHGWDHINADEHTPEEVLKDAMDARKFLEDLFQRECRGFAWPYGVHPEAARNALRNAGFAYGRTCENSENVHKYDDPLALASSCHFQSAEFEERMERARTGSGYFYFWGHTYEMMDSPELWNSFEEKLRRIAENPDNTWIDVIDLVS